MEVTPHYIGVDELLNIVLLHLIKRSINNKTESSFLIHKPNRLLPGHQDLPVQQELLSNAYKYNTQLLTGICRWVLILGEEIRFWLNGGIVKAQHLSGQVLLG